MFPHLLEYNLLIIGFSTLTFFSLNIDGIHIGRSNVIKVTHSMITIGDDYVSLSDGNQDMGIIVGSLGKYKKEEDVFGLTVINCTFTRTSNSPDSQAGKAFNFTFKDLVTNNVENPL
ncbi:hypothetical protein CUMW_245250 [Citrus unshiu]|nr:hypothetical protein CUMW_245250 [Citrus unshiu]